MNEEDEEFERIKRHIELETLPLINFTKQKEWVDLTEDDSPALKMFVTFAKLVAEHEREACAKLCESYFERVMASRIRTRG